MTNEELKQKIEQLEEQNMNQLIIVVTARQERDELRKRLQGMTKTIRQLETLRYLDGGDIPFDMVPSFCSNIVEEFGEKQSAMTPPVWV